MTAKIIAFPGAEGPSAGGKQSFDERLKDNITMAIHCYQQGRRLEDLPADMDPEMRQTMEIILRAIERVERS